MSLFNYFSICETYCTLSAQFQHKISFILFCDKSHIAITFPTTKKKQTAFHCPLLFVLALPIFPGRRQPSIFGAGELNFRVRDGNGWTLTAINTNLLSFEKKSKQKKL